MDGLSQMMKDHFRSGKPIYQQGLPFPDGTVILRAGTDSGSLMNVISVHQVIELDDLSDALPDLTPSSLSDKNPKKKDGLENAPGRLFTLSQFVHPSRFPLFASRLTIPVPIRHRLSFARKDRGFVFPWRSRSPRSVLRLPSPDSPLPISMNGVNGLYSACHALYFYIGNSNLFVYQHISHTSPSFLQ